MEGHVSPAGEAVRAAFIDNFDRRRELDTMVIVYSAAKGLAATTLALAHSRGWLDYDERPASTST